MDDYVKIKLYYYDDKDQQWIESLWAKPYNENYILDNSPFYALDYALGDVVSGKMIEGQLFVDSLIEESGNSNIQVVFFDKTLVQKIRNELKEMGCSSELSDRPHLIAVNVPKEVDYFGKIRPYLDEYSNKEIIGYGEACLAHSET